MITIKLSVPVIHGTSPHQMVVDAIELLKRTVDASTPETPALGGVLRAANGQRIGSYLVEFT
jgi:hypothetical protein